ncbi:CRISPR-associated protein, Cmr4 family [Marinactinospora thermotolerans DSM 45154]|uniref:CRISPR-associated protein, Cmr4 family n=1 Tax=Marinactinospora thermotolerans DSM 45154 TaxID=1122192 RepID=A0A1T4S4H3_9ACTN|nr:type III-B CRISPR module RAMP protein Cmr4 [Marinactinospora thermotolerans]SKA23200.1 CRISPR-associated protein, Cmr4 family [Marinactinospora thermotolerans DSM 45154]
MKDLLAFFYTESPLHAGASASEGIIDLPIQREAHTRYPVVYGQSLKGALRQAAEEHPDWSDRAVVEVFGSPVGQGGPTTPGLLSVGDAQLVALPIPTLRRTFAWVTSVVALGRLARKYRAANMAAPRLPREPAEALSTGHGWTAEQAFGPLVLHIGEADEQDLLQAWAERIRSDAFAHEDAFAPFAAKFSQDLVLVHSDAMATLVEEGTEVSVRVQLSYGKSENDDGTQENQKNTEPKRGTKTVQNGPFHSEYLPAETILASNLSLRGSRAGAEPDPEHVRLLTLLLHGSGTTLHQFGGDESLGKGLVWTRLAGIDQGFENGVA